MKNWWIKLGCFLTGYNYKIVRNSSEIAAKAVKRYTSAMLVICILWAFIGYSFTNRYLHGNTFQSIAGASIFVIFVVQIERQIILSINPSKWLYLSRGLIALAMAIIGAVIVDQLIFKEDIELEKITFLEDRIKVALPPKTTELKQQIASLDTAILRKELEREAIIEAVRKSSTIPLTTSTLTPTLVTEMTPDGDGVLRPTNKVKNLTSRSTTNVPNPKQDQIAPLYQSIQELRADKIQKETNLLNIRPQVEKEIRSKVGFLDELEVMFSLINRSNVALFFWLLWLFLFLGLELLVLISKMNEKENDYEKTVKHHMALQMRKLDLLARNVNNE